MEIFRNRKSHAAGKRPKSDTGPIRENTQFLFCRVEKALFFKQTKGVFSTIQGPGPDALLAGRLRVQKSTLSVFNDVNLPGQSFNM